ncbi:MAG: alpha/beta fold hydrolase, partial [Acidimicrobiales bacterium]|nr:alpha/beta fold hydrolase [Acidimicrobiales bacterium]
MPHIAVGEIDLYYETHGAGPPALLISGTGNDLRRSFPDRSPLNKVCTTTHFDQRGLGQSAKPDTTYSMADYADDAAGLLDALGIAEAVVMGVSFGGMVAQNLVARHPGRARKLVLACTSAGGAGGSSADLLALSKLPVAERLAASMAIVDTRLATAPEGED